MVACFSQPIVIVPELGHNIGLYHDGNSTTEYFAGFDVSRDNPISWGPIMVFYWHPFRQVLFQTGGRL